MDEAAGIPLRPLPYYAEFNAQPDYLFRRDLDFVQDGITDRFARLDPLIERKDGEYTDRLLGKVGHDRDQLAERAFLLQRMATRTKVFEADVDLDVEILLLEDAPESCRSSFLA